MENINKKAIAFDFDGVIHKYSKGWQNGSIYDEIDGKIIKLITKLHKEKYPIFIFSTRDSQQIKEWLDSKILIKTRIIKDDELFYKDTENIGITNRKLAAILYIDDRAYRYNNNKSYEEIVQELKEYINELEDETLAAKQKEHHIEFLPELNCEFTPKYGGTYIYTLTKDSKIISNHQLEIRTLANGVYSVKK